MKVWSVISRSHTSNCVGVGQFAVEQEVGHLQEGRVLGQLLDRIAAVTEDAGVAVEIGDGALTGRRRRERRGRRTRSREAVSDHSAAGTPPFSKGISRDCPVRLSVIVMLSATRLNPSVGSASRRRPILDAHPHALTNGAGPEPVNRTDLDRNRWVDPAGSRLSGRERHGHRDRVAVPAGHRQRARVGADGRPGGQRHGGRGRPRRSAAGRRRPCPVDRPGATRDRHLHARLRARSRSCVTVTSAVSVPVGGTHRRCRARDGRRPGDARGRRRCRPHRSARPGVESHGGDDQMVEGCERRRAMPGRPPWPRGPAAERRAVAIGAGTHTDGWSDGGAGRPRPRTQGPEPGVGLLEGSPSARHLGAAWSAEISVAAGPGSPRWARRPPGSGCMPSSRSTVVRSATVGRCPQVHHRVNRARRPSWGGGDAGSAPGGPGSRRRPRPRRAPAGARPGPFRGRPSWSVSAPGHQGRQCGTGPGGRLPHPVGQGHVAGGGGRAVALDWVWMAISDPATRTRSRRRRWR